MKIALSVIALMAALSMASFAADFNGKLMDATCADQNHSSTSSATTSSTTSTTPSSSSSAASASPSSSKASCNATTATTAFAIEANGKTYKLDSAGNTKAAEAIKSRADRSADPTKSMSQSYTAKVSGTESNGTISVQSIDIQ
ncbi:MAG TPA: hypothetical protein VHA14_11505 [Bryobacteraceae bacterium]|nr:hypothetical protein [Bryobacteraceae bacterium]